jgi:hypothetical protein
MRSLLALIFVIFLGCSNVPSSPLSVQETSSARPQLADRIKFIENYVTFKRNYNKLEYDITYQNNGGGIVPGPSDWDIKLLAVIPAAEIVEWIPTNATRVNAQPPKWLIQMSGSIPITDMTEWYRTRNSEIGIDRANSTIAFRSTTMPN